jgi:hypothetical protein
MTEKLLSDSKLSFSPGLLLEKSRVEAELKKREKANPLEFYWPHAYGCDGESCDTYISHHGPLWDGSEYDTQGCPQYSFHTSLCRTRAFFGGNRSGKTTAGTVEVAFATTGYYPDWYPKERRYTRATKGRIFAKDFSKGVGEVITPAIEAWFPKGSIKDKSKNNQGIYTKYWVKHESGKYSVFDILTYEQDPDMAEGWSGDFGWFDEPPPREHRIATARGLVDYVGWELFTLTPLKEPWVFDEIYESKDPDTTSFIADIRHNLFRINPLTEKGIGVPEEGIEILEKTITEEEKEVRRHGKFRFLSGRIWKGWDRGVHTFSRSIWTSAKTSLIDGEPPRDWARIFLIDPHDRKEHALLWVAKEPDYGRFFAYREGWIEDETFGKAVEFIKEVEVAARERVIYRYIDPNFGPKMQRNTNQTVRQTFEDEAKARNYPMSFAWGDDHKELGRKRVSEMLAYDTTKPISLINRPQLLIAEDLVHCIYQIEHYIWDDYKLAGNRDPKEKEKDINTDFPSLLRYLSLANIQDIPPQVLEPIGKMYT